MSIIPPTYSLPLNFWQYRKTTNTTFTQWNTKTPPETRDDEHLTDGWQTPYSNAELWLDL